MEGLRDDIQLHLELDTDPARAKFWEAVIVVCNWELALAAQRRGEVLGDERGIHSSVLPAVDQDLQCKTLSELDLLQHEIEIMMSSGGAQVVEFWEASVRRAQVFKAMAFLKEAHANLLSRKHLQGLDEVEDEAIDCDTVSTQQKSKAVKAMGRMEEGDEELGAAAEINMDLEVYWWHDKYQTRKPKYFNRVHPGYEWNKYSRTHYDHGSPPPKTMQGYKFNVFYPDLIDKSRAPVYTVEEDRDGNGENCILKFQGGPPYEDIAFCIVNKEWEKSRNKKEWEKSRNKGFKSTFDHVTLQLYFNFKRYRYRR